METIANNQNQELNVKQQETTPKVSNQHQSDFTQLQQLLAPYDYLVCLSVETTHDKEKFDYDYRRCFLDNTLAQIAQRLKPDQAQEPLKDLEEAQTIAKMDDFINNSNFPNIIQMNWCAYNLRKAVVEFDMSVHIKPTNMAQLNEETIEKTGVTQDELEKHGFTLQTAIQKFTDMVYNKILCRNQSFQIVTCGDWVLQYQFSIEAIQKQIRLGQHFQQFINILSLYYASVNFQASSGGPFIRDVSQILAAVDLQEKKVPQKSKQMCQSLTRIINRLVVNMNQCKELSPRSSRQQRRSRSRSRSQEQQDQQMKIENQQMPPTIQVVNCPAFIEQTDLAQFFNEIPFKTFEFQEQPDGLRRTWTIQLENQDDLTKALALNGQILKEETIQVNQLQRSMATNGQHRNEDLVALRMRGIPFSANQQDIMLFFSGFNIESNHIKIGENSDGRPSGQAAVCLENEDEAKRAYTEKQGQHLGHRWIELYQIRYHEFQSFSETQKSNQKQQVILNHYLTDANADRALRLRGLPWSATTREIVEFFEGFSIDESDIVIEQKNGKPSGYALVFMKNSQDAQNARQQLDRKNMGRRYVDVLFANQKH